MKFKDLNIGREFTFTDSTSFFNVCKKVSARCYTWISGTEEIEPGVFKNIVVKSRVGSHNVEITPYDTHIINLGEYLK